MSVLVIILSLISLAALCVSVLSLRASGSSLPLKRCRDLEAQIADLNSSFDALMDSHKRLRSRSGMRELREKDQQREGEPPPPGASKEEVRAYYGLSGKVGPDWARQQMSIAKRGDK